MSTHHVCELAAITWAVLILTFHAVSQLATSSLHRWIHTTTTK
jgi:hypothetical protein